jgi:hypothetical protein
VQLALYDGPPKAVRNEILWRREEPPCLQQYCVRGIDNKIGKREFATLKNTENFKAK